MADLEVAFLHELALKAIRDYTQFQTLVFTSMRGGGKTVLVQENKLLKPFLRHGRCFVYIRESQIEIDNTLQGGFWDPYITSKGEYSNVQFSIKGNLIYINGEVAGVAVALTTYCNVRGSVFNFGVSEKINKKRQQELEDGVEQFEKFAKRSEVNEIFFDEFEPLKPKMTGSNRLKAYLHIAETYFRFRQNVHATLCANIENAFSPFLSEFNFPDLRNLSYGLKKSYTREKKPRPLAVWVHIKPNNEWLELRKDSYVGKITGGSDMFTTGNASIGLDYRTTPKETRRVILYNLSVDGCNFTYWTDKKGKYFISERTKNKTYRTYTFKLNQCNSTVELMSDGLQNQLLRAYASNQIYFDSSKAFEEFISILPKGRGKQ